MSYVGPRGPCRYPGGGALVLVAVSPVLLHQSCQGVRSCREPVLRAEDSLLGVARDVIGPDQRREEEGGMHGADCHQP